MDIIAYTDGSALGNPGKGGYGVVLISGPHRKEISQGFKLTTNNRMELLAVIVALESLKIAGSNIIIYSDSRYVVDSILKKWVFTWEKKNFAGKKNEDLWKRFLQIYPKHNVKIQWIKAHVGIKENERCDRLAVEAANSNNLLNDVFYENNSEY